MHSMLTSILILSDILTFYNQLSTPLNRGRVEIISVEKYKAAMYSFSKLDLSMKSLNIFLQPSRNHRLRNVAWTGGHRPSEIFKTSNPSNESNTVNFSGVHNIKVGHKILLNVTFGGFFCSYKIFKTTKTLPDLLCHSFSR